MTTRHMFKYLPALLALALGTPTGQANPGDFTVRSAGGTNVFKLADAKGKFVALHFLLKMECPDCIKHTRDYVQKSAGDAPVIQVFLKPDTDAEIKAWAAKLGEDSLKLTVYRDPEAALANSCNIPDACNFHGQTVHFPALLLLDGSGKEVFRYVGRSNGDRFSCEKFSAKLKELTGPSPR